MTKPHCARCASIEHIAIYDMPLGYGAEARVPLCPEHSPRGIEPLVCVRDVDAHFDVACWCGMRRHNLVVLWCPTHGWLAPPTEQWSPHRNDTSTKQLLKLKE